MQYGGSETAANSKPWDLFQQNWCHVYYTLSPLNSVLSSSLIGVTIISVTRLTSGIPDVRKPMLSFLHSGPCSKGRHTGRRLKQMLSYTIYHICHSHIKEDGNKSHEFYCNILVRINISQDYKWNSNTKLWVRPNSCPDLNVSQGGQDLSFRRLIRIESASLKAENWSQACCLEPESGQNSRKEAEKRSLHKASHQNRQKGQGLSQPRVSCVTECALLPLTMRIRNPEIPDGTQWRQPQNCYAFGSIRQPGKVKWVTTLTQSELSNQNSKIHE